jgi:hypothetical protein
VGRNAPEEQRTDRSLKEALMKKAITISLAVLTLLYWSCSREEEWLAFNSHEGGFIIEAPGILNEQGASMETMIGPVKFTAHVLEHDKVLYMVGYSDWPDSIIEQKPGGELLDFAIEGAIANLKGTVTRKTAITLGKYAGRELMVDQVTMNQEHTIRVYLVGNRMYQLSVVIPKRDEFKRRRVRFLDGFKLLD